MSIGKKCFCITFVFCANSRRAHDGKRECPVCKSDVASEDFSSHRRECEAREQKRLEEMPREGDVRCPLCLQVI